MSEEDNIKPEDSLTSISSFLNIPKEQLNNIDNVTLGALTQKFKEFKEIESHNLRLADSFNDLKTSSDSAQNKLKNDVENLLKENDIIRKESTQLENELSLMKNEKIIQERKIRSTCDELMDLQKEIRNKDQTRSDLMKLLNDKITEIDEIKSQTASTLESQKEQSQKYQKLISEIEEIKTKNLSLEREIDKTKHLLDYSDKQTNWLNQELESTKERFVTYRNKKEKSLEETTANLTSLRNELHVTQHTNSKLIDKNGSLNKELQLKSSELEELQENMMNDKKEFEHERCLQKKLIDVLEKQVKSFQEKLASNFDSTLTISDSVKNEGASEQAALLQRRLEKSEMERAQLEAKLTRYEVNDTSDKNDTNGSWGNIDSTTSVYADITLLRNEYQKEKSEKDHLENQIQLFISELEKKVPIINSFKEKTTSLENDLTNISLLLEHTSTNNKQISEELELKDNIITELREQLYSVVTQRKHLANQVQYLLINLDVYQDGKKFLNSKELKFLADILNNEKENSIDSDSATAISKNIVKFRSVMELQQQNMKLLQAVETLSSRAEYLENITNNMNGKTESDTIREAKEAILALETYNNSLENEMVTLKREFESYKSLSVNSTYHMDSTENENSHKALKQKYIEIVNDLESQLSNAMSESKTNTESFRKEIADLRSKNSELVLNYESEKSKNDLIQQRLKLLQNTLDLTKSENQHLLLRADQLNDTISKNDSRMASVLKNYVNSKSKLSALELNIENANSVVTLITDNRDSLKSAFEKVQEERNSLKVQISKLQSIQNEKDSLWITTETKYKSMISYLTEKNSDIIRRLSLKNNELKDFFSSRESEIKWFKEKLEVVREESDAFRNESNEKSSKIENLSLEIISLQNIVKENSTLIESYKTKVDSNENSIKEEKLREELQNTNISLNNANSRLNEYKSELSETQTSLKELTELHDGKNMEYANSTEMLKNSIKDLEAKNELLNHEINNINNELKHQEESFNDEKSHLTKLLENMQHDKSNIETIKSDYENKIIDLKKQVEYANSYQQNHEDELRNHSDLIKTISELREEILHNEQKIKDLSAQEDIRTRESENEKKGWNTQKQEYENQIKILESRINDSTMQKKLSSDELNTTASSGGSTKDASEMLHKQNNQLIENLRNERDILGTKLSTAEQSEILAHQKINELEENIMEIKSELSKFQNDPLFNKNIAESDGELNKKISLLDLLREENKILREQISESDQKNLKQSKQIEESKDNIYELKYQLDEIRSINTEKENQIEFLNKKNELLENRAQELLQKSETVDSDKLELLLEDIGAKKNQLSEVTKQNEELEGRFSRLKKQAHERLDASKQSNALLTENFEKLQIEKEELETRLIKEQDKTTSLEQTLANANSTGSKLVEELKNELKMAKINSKEIENKLNDTIKTSNELIEKLNTEINKLKSELEEAKMAEWNRMTAGDRNDDYGKIIEDMKKTFEEEKIQFIRERTKEFERKQEEQEARLNNITGNNSSVNNATLGTQHKVVIDALKKQWEDQYEICVLRRIEEAEENLKKQFKLPTEEKINQIIEERKNLMEQDFDKRIQDEARKLIKSSEFEDIMKNVKEEVTKDLTEHHNNELQIAKKKSFEEGQQQASMKTTFLQNKISSLEATLKKDTVDRNKAQNENKNKNAVTNETEITTDSDNHTNPTVGNTFQQHLGSNLESAQPSLTFDNSPLSNDIGKPINPTITFQSSTSSGGASQENPLQENPFGSFGSSPFTSKSNLENPFSNIKPSFALTDVSDETPSKMNLSNINKRPAEDNMESEDSETKKSKIDTEEEEEEDNHSNDM